MNKQEWISFMNMRSSLYRFLSGIYLMEVDEDQLSAMKNMVFPVVSGDDDADMDLREGYALLDEFCKTAKAYDLENLAADYAKVFLAAGDAAGRAAFPYESVYVDQKHQVGGSTAMKMKALYLERGYEPDPKAFKTMDDHIGLIMEYMSILCDETGAALEAGDSQKAGDLLNEQKKFMKKHIVNWVYSFTSDIVKFTDTEFYKGIARVTNGFVKKEMEFLGGGKSWDIV